MKAQIIAMIDRYRHAVHTQEADDFYPLWNPQAQCTLISPGDYYTGVDSIYSDFLIGGIRKAYSRIDLITENVDVRIVNDGCAIAIFAYSTDCDRRDTGEKFGIAGLETQVYNKVDGEWKLTHVHYSGVKKP